MMTRKQLFGIVCLVQVAFGVFAGGTTWIGLSFFLFPYKRELLGYMSESQFNLVHIGFVILFGLGVSYFLAKKIWDPVHIRKGQTWICLLFFIVPFGIGWSILDMCYGKFFPSTFLFDTICVSCIIIVFFLVTLCWRKNYQDLKRMTKPFQDMIETLRSTQAMLKEIIDLLPSSATRRVESVDRLYRSLEYERDKIPIYLENVYKDSEENWLCRIDEFMTELRRNLPRLANEMEAVIENKPGTFGKQDSIVLKYEEWLKTTLG